MATTIAIVLLTLTYTFCGYSLPQGDTIWMQSPRITPWGKFGPDEFCPVNSFVTGMRLKVEHEHLNDNTGLNAIQLLCSSLNGADNVNITSATGRFGYYGGSKYCPTGFATGFQLRSQPGQGLYRDDVAAVDFKLLCIDIDGTPLQVVDEDNEYLSWGYWTQYQHCPEHTAVCGIATQVEDLGENRKMEDETSLNNVDIACCSLSQSIKFCQLKYNWESVITCSNDVNFCEKEILSTGFAETEHISRQRESYHATRKDFDGFVMKMLKVKAKRVPEKINNDSLDRILRRMKIKKKKLPVKVKCVGIIQQLVVICGFIKLYTDETRCIPDEYSDMEWNGLYFQPTSQFETIFWSYNCDFVGSDIQDTLSDIADCGDICLTNAECTHFAWNKYNGGTCWMKGSRILPTPIERHNDNTLCGWIDRPQTTDTE